MIGADVIRAIIDQYEKYGWQLRRVLLTGEMHRALEADLSELFGDAEITVSDLNAAWFSRSSRADLMAWELRLLDDFPFALVEVVHLNATPAALATAQAGVESRMKERIAPSQRGH
jgi:hypothetical protein